MFGRQGAGMWQLLEKFKKKQKCVVKDIFMRVKAKDQKLCLIIFLSLKCELFLFLKFIFYSPSYEKKILYLNLNSCLKTLQNPKKKIPRGNVKEGKSCPRDKTMPLSR